MKTDIAIIGAGIAGASLAYWLSPQANTFVLEAESHAGYHTTGRSAAFFTETYGGPEIQPLTAASKAFLAAPPDGFSATPILTPRGALYIAQAHQRDALDRLETTYRARAPHFHRISAEETAQRAPMLKSGWAVAGLYDPQCQDIDVHALHSGFLRDAQRKGAQLLTANPVHKVTHTGQGWMIETPTTTIQARILVNAAGAWGDALANLAGAAPLGLHPLRRTVMSFTPQEWPVDRTAPLILDVEDRFYFKPDGQDIWASPADETPCPPSDVQPDEETIALAAARIEEATRYRIGHIRRRWAGLRTFAQDRIPVFGFDPDTPDFFWCVGQGGAGIQTSVAAGALCAALICQTSMPDFLREVSPQIYSPARWRSPLRHNS